MDLGSSIISTPVALSFRSMTIDKNSSITALTTEPAQPPSLYALIGGGERLRELVDRFYDLMDLEPDFAGIRVLHPTSLDGSRDKFFWFLSGWSGGPDLFVERFGHPRLRARHLPYAISTPERDQWLRCMALAMQDVQMEEGLQQRLLASFFDTADWMRNKADKVEA